MSLLSPDRYFTGVHKIPISLLKEMGIQLVLIDHDNTICPRETHCVTDLAQEWIKRVQDAGIKVCVVSNNWSHNVGPVLDDIGVEYVCSACKPLPFIYWKIAAEHKLKRDEMLMVGDQVFTDILGANVAGISTILVKPQVDVDLKYSLALRPLERKVLKGREPEA